MVEKIPVKSCKIGARAPLRPVPPEDQLDPRYFSSMAPVPVHLMSGRNSRVNREQSPLVSGQNPEYFLKGAGTTGRYNQRYPVAVHRNYPPVAQPYGRPMQLRNNRMPPKTAQNPSNYRNFGRNHESRSFFRPFGK